MGRPLGALCKRLYTIFSQLTGMLIDYRPFLESSTTGSWQVQQRRTTPRTAAPAGVEGEQGQSQILLVGVPTVKTGWAGWAAWHLAEEGRNDCCPASELWEQALGAVS